MNDWKDIQAHNKQIKQLYDECIKQAEEYKNEVIDPCTWCYYESKPEINDVIICNECCENFYSNFRRTKPTIGHK